VPKPKNEESSEFVLGIGKPREGEHSPALLEKLGPGYQEFLGQKGARSGMKDLGRPRPVLGRGGGRGNCRTMVGCVSFPLGLENPSF